MYILETAQMRVQMDSTLALTTPRSTNNPTPMPIALDREPVSDRHWVCSGFSKLPPLVICDVGVRRYGDGRRIECLEAFHPYVLFDVFLGHDGECAPPGYQPAPFIVAIAVATQFYSWIGSARGNVLLGEFCTSMQCYLPLDYQDRKIIAREDGSGLGHHLIWVPQSVAYNRPHYSRVS